MAKNGPILKTNALTIVGLIISIITAYISKENIPIVVGVFLIILVANVLDTISEDIEKNSEKIKKNEERLNIYKELIDIKTDMNELKREVFKNE